MNRINISTTIIFVPFAVVLLLSGCGVLEKNCIYVPDYNHMHYSPYSKYDWRECVDEVSAKFQQEFGFKVKIPSAKETIAIVGMGSGIMLGTAAALTIPGSVPVAVGALGANEVLTEDKSTRESPHYTFQDLDHMALESVISCVHQRNMQFNGMGNQYGPVPPQYVPIPQYGPAPPQYVPIPQYGPAPPQYVPVTSPGKH